MVLTSSLFADNDRLQKAAENSPPLRTPETGEAVARLQQALVQLGYAMPISTKADGTMDGVYGNETRQVVWKYQVDHPPLAKDGEAGHDTLHSIDEQIGGKPSRFRGFTTGRQTQLMDDIELAKGISRQCVSMLIFNRLGMPSNVSGLLVDTFGIDGSDQDQVFPIRQNYMNFSPRIENTSFIFTQEGAPTSDHMGHAAYVKYTSLLGVLPPTEIYITQGYFDMPDIVDRAVTLIHEYIHLINKQPGHPGNNNEETRFQLFARSNMGLEYDAAVVNAYCYEYFAKWLFTGQ